MRFIIAVCVLLYAAPLMAETYSWEDETGTINFTENYSSIPAKYRKKMEKRQDMGGEPVQSTAVPTPAAKETAAAPAEKSSSPVGTFGGMTNDQWKQDLQQRESALWDIKKRIDALDAMLIKPYPDREQKQAAVKERNDLFQQFTETKKQYDVTVEAARKAGITVEIK